MAANKGSKSRQTKGKKKSKPVGVNIDLVKALAHELRVEILTILNERMASPNELSKELGEGLSQVSYHVKVLKDYGTITQVKTEPRRGAVEHYYRATARPYIDDQDWQKLPDSVREGMSADLMQLVLDDVSAGLEAGTVDANKDRHMSRSPLLLDRKGWKELNKLLGRTLDSVMKIQTEASDRLSGSDEEGMDVMVALMGVELPEAAAGKPKGKSKAKAKGKAKRK